MAYAATVHSRAPAQRVLLYNVSYCMCCCIVLQSRGVVRCICCCIHNSPMCSSTLYSSARVRHDVLETTQHTAAHCNTLNHTATHCCICCYIIQQSPCAAWCSQHTAAHCSTLQHTATHWNTLSHKLLHHTTVPMCSVMFSRAGAIT